MSIPVRFPHCYQSGHCKGHKAESHPLFISPALLCLNSSTLLCLNSPMLLCLNSPTLLLFYSFLMLFWILVSVLWSLTWVLDSYIHIDLLTKLCTFWGQGKCLIYFCIFFVFPESSAISLFYQTINKHEFVTELTVFSQNSYVEDLTSNVIVPRDRILKEVIKLSESYGWGPSPMQLVSI